MSLFLFLYCVSSILGTSNTCLALPSPSRTSHARSVNVEDKPPYFILAGDSTTAPTQAWKDGKAPGGGGWGDGFLSTLQSPAGGINHGHNGQTTVSFKEKGFWASVLEEVKKHRDSKSVFVTIQFGHNDQKMDKGISNAQLENNLEKMVKEIKDLKGVPILVTPLTRRSFSSATSLSDSLANEAAATKKAAANAKTVVIDLNAKSKKYVEAIGKAEATKYNADYEPKNAQKSKDNTHLNKHGSEVFGRIVADLIVEQVPEVGRWVKRNMEMSGAIKAGNPA